MAINFTDFSKAPIQESPWANIFENVLKGYQIAEAPRTMKREAQAKELANSLQKLALEHKPKEYALSDALKQAQIEKARRPAGIGGTALKANGKLANFIVSHPNATQEEITKFADTLSEAELKHLNQTTSRSQVLNETQHTRDAPQIVKKEEALMQIDKGYLPGTQTKLTPDQQAKFKNDVLLSVVKDTTDADTRKKLINATNLNITLADVNPEKLTQYSGAKGQIKKMGDTIRESAGKGSRDYKDYVGEVQKATAAAKQLRAYLGDSIQPSQQERLAHLTNPEAWNVSPALAAANYRYMQDLMKRETQTLVRAGTDATLYQTAANPGGTQSHVGKTYNLATRRWE